MSQKSAPRTLPRLLQAPAVLDPSAVDDRPIGDDDLLQHHTVQSLATRKYGIHRIRELRIFHHRSLILASRFEYGLVTGLGHRDYGRHGPLCWAAYRRSLSRAWHCQSAAHISLFSSCPRSTPCLWKHMMMNPVYGVLAQVWIFFGAEPINWLTDYPLFSIILIVSWQWLPFAALIFITALQSMDREQLEAARMDGATYLQQLRYLYLPHLSRPIAVVVMIEMIFLLSIFAEIFTTTQGGPSDAKYQHHVPDLQTSVVRF